MPMVSTMPAMPGNVSVAFSADKAPIRQIRLRISAKSAITPESR